MLANRMNRWRKGGESIQKPNIHPNSSSIYSHSKLQAEGHQSLSCPNSWIQPLALVPLIMKPQLSSTTDLASSTPAPTPRTLSGLQPNVPKS